MCCPSKETTRQWTDLAPQGAGEANALSARDNSLNSLQGLVDRGPGTKDVDASLGASRGLADMLQQYSQSGGLPGQEDMNAANGFAQRAFDPQRVALDQSFRSQNTEAERLSARLGRPVNDPILQAKLRTGFMDQQAQLQAQQGAYGSNLALQLPGQRLNYATQRANTLGTLATQAFQNRAAILGMGSDIAQADRQWRLQSGVRNSETVKEKSFTDAFGDVLALGGSVASLAAGFGAGGALGGAMGGAGAAAGAANVAAGAAPLNWSQSLAPQIGSAAQSFAPPAFGASAPGASGFSTDSWGFGGGGGKSYSLGAF